MRIFLIFLLFPFVTFAQLDSGYVHFFIYPDQCKVIINDSLIVKTKSKIMLPQGIHNIKITGDKLKSVNENFKVTKDSILTYRKIMSYNDAYKTYKSELREYTLAKSAMITSTSLIAGLTLYLTYNYTFQARNNMKSSYDNAMNYKNLFDNSYNSVDMLTYENEFNKHKDNYYKYKKQVYLALPVFLVGSFLTYKSFKYTKTIKKPNYLESLSVNYNLFNNQYYISYAF